MSEAPCVQASHVAQSGMPFPLVAALTMKEYVTPEGTEPVVKLSGTAGQAVGQSSKRVTAGELAAKAGPNVTSRMAGSLK